MPLASPRQQPVRTRPAFPQRQIQALIAYVASFGGPAIPTVDPGSGSLSQGQQLFALDCAGCHTIQAGRRRDRRVRAGADAGDAARRSPRRSGSDPTRCRRSDPASSRTRRSTRSPATSRAPTTRRSRRLGHRPDRPDHRGHGRMAARDRRAAGDRAPARRAHARAQARLQHRNQEIERERAAATEAAPTACGRRS